MEITVVVGASSGRHAQEAIDCDSAKDCRSGAAVFRPSARPPAPWLKSFLWLNKAVPVVPDEFRGGGNVFDRL